MLKGKQIKTSIRCLLFVVCNFLFVSIPQAIYGVSWQGEINPDVAKPIQNFCDEYAILLNGIMGFGIMTGVLVFVINAIKLAQASNNPGIRQLIIYKMLISGICIAGIGASMFIFNLIAAIAIG